MARDFAVDFYRSKAWKRTRELYADSVNGLCEDCLAKGIYTPGKVVHHIKHLTPANINDERVTLSFDNLRLVCQDCHAEEHKNAVKLRYRFDEQGNVITDTPPGQGGKCDP